jgi:hypothetical protein
VSKLTESPAPVEATAKLPDGAEFTDSGQGTWHLVAGPETLAGNGDRVYTYTVEVEDGIDSTSYSGDETFASTVDSILADPRSWIGDGTISLRRTTDPDVDPDFRISLTTPGTAHRPDLCGFEIPYESSCNLTVKRRIVISLARWIRGAEAFEQDLVGYRQYAINHEVGHALGHKHTGCATDGSAAPVMMQQSFGVSNDYVASLNATDPRNSSRVPADGKVCRPNSWPNP